MIKYLEVDGHVSLHKLDTAFARAKAMLIDNSVALQQLYRALQQHAKLIIANLEQ